MRRACSALSLWCLPCHGAVHRRRVVARGTRPLDVSTSRRGRSARCVAGHGMACGVARCVAVAWHGARCGAVRGVRRPTRSGVGWGSARFSDRSTCRVASWRGARRGVQRHGAVRGVRGRPTWGDVAWGSAWFSAARCVVSRHGTVRGVACGGVARCVVGGGTVAHDVRRGVAWCAVCGGAWRGVQQHGAVRGVRPPDVGWRGCGVHRAVSSCVVLQWGACAASSLYGVLRRGAPCSVTVVRRAAVGCMCRVVAVLHAAAGCTVPRHRRASCYGGSCRRCMSPGVASPGCRVAAGGAACCVLVPCPRCSTVPRVVSLSRVVLRRGTAHCLRCRVAAPLCRAMECCGVSCYGMVARLVSPSCIAVASRHVSRLAVRRVVARMSCMPVASRLRVALQRGAAARHATATLLAHITQ